MSARSSDDDKAADEATPAAPARLALDPVAPGPIAVGAGTALVLEGTQEGPLPRDAGVRVGGLEQPLDASGVRGADGSRWWAVVPVPAGADTGGQTIALGAGAWRAELGSVELAPAPPPVEAAPAPAGEGPLIAVCMATHEPPPERLRRQIDSIREQAWGRWVCVISDDCSSDAGLAAIEDAVGGDPRFQVSRSPERLGFLRNFERAIRMAPPEAELIAPADQDDRWFPDKLAALAAVLDDAPGARLAYSDMRIVDGRGDVLSDTFWYLRGNACDDIGSMLVTNTVTGAASLFRRELLDDALPFPPAHPTHVLYHDHWLALCALATSEIAYLDRPTYDYYRYEDSITVREAPNWVQPRSGFARRLRLGWARVTRRARMWNTAPSWERIYRERWLLIRQQVVILELRLGDRIVPRHRRSMRLLLGAERSPRAAAWLVLRCLRPLIGRNETLSRERVLLGGLLWRWSRGRDRRAG